MAPIASSFISRRRYSLAGQDGASAEPLLDEQRMGGRLAIMCHSPAAYPEQERVIRQLEESARRSAAYMNFALVVLALILYVVYSGPHRKSEYCIGAL